MKPSDSFLQCVACIVWQPDSLYIYLCQSSFYKSWFLYHFGCSSKPSCSLIKRGPRYWHINVMIWRLKMTFLKDRYLENWGLEASDFSAWVLQYQLSKKSSVRNDKFHPWNWQIFIQFQFNLYLMSIALNHTILKLLRICFFSSIISNLFTVFHSQKMDVSNKIYVFAWMDFNEWTYS